MPVGQLQGSYQKSWLSFAISRATCQTQNRQCPSVQGLGRFWHGGLVAYTAVTQHLGVMWKKWTSSINVICWIPSI